MSRFFAPILFFTVLCPLWGQSSSNLERIDSLEQLLETETEATRARVDRLNALGFEYWIISPQQSLIYAEAALQIADSIGYPSGLAFAHRITGVAHLTLSNPYLALLHLFPAREIYGSLDDSLNVANLDLNLGMVYTEQEDYAAARQRLEAALEVFEALSNDARIATTYTKLGELLTAEGNYETAFDYLERSLHLHRQNDFAYGIAETNGKLGQLSLRRGGYESAIAYFLLAVQAAGERYDHYGISEYFHGIGRAYLEKGYFSRAEDYLNRALKMGEAFGFLAVKAEALNSLSDLEDRRGNSARALEYLRSLRMIRDSIFNRERANLISGLEARRLSAEKTKNLEIARKDLELLNRKRRSDRILRIILLLNLLLLLGAGLYLFQRKNRSLRAKKRALRKAEVTQEELRHSLKRKDQELAAYTLNFLQKNQTIEAFRGALDQLKKQIAPEQRPTLREVSRKLEAVLRVDDDWEDFRRHFESVHPDYIQELTTRHPDLTNNELRLVALLRLNLSSKEISTILGISPDSVKTARYRLRKKMKLEPTVDLINYLFSLAK